MLNETCLKPPPILLNPFCITCSILLPQGSNKKLKLQGTEIILVFIYLLFYIIKNNNNNGSNHASYVP